MKYLSSIAAHFCECYIQNSKEASINVGSPIKKKWIRKLIVTLYSKINNKPLVESSPITLEKMRRLFI